MLMASACSEREVQPSQETGCRGDVDRRDSDRPGCRAASSRKSARAGAASTCRHAHPWSRDSTTQWPRRTPLSNDRSPPVRPRRRNCSALGGQVIVRRTMIRGCWRRDRRSTIFLVTHAAERAPQRPRSAHAPATLDDASPRRAGASVTGGGGYRLEFDHRVAMARDRHALATRARSINSDKTVPGFGDAMGAHGMIMRYPIALLPRCRSPAAHLRHHWKIPGSPLAVVATVAARTSSVLQFPTRNQITFGGAPYRRLI